jgi:hypothetical protein
MSTFTFTAPDAGLRGPSVDLRGRDQQGRSWGDRISGPRGEGDQDPDQLIAEQPAVDRNAWVPGERYPSSTYGQRLARSIAPGRNADQRNPASLRGLQALMDAHYRRR